MPWKALLLLCAPLLTSLSAGQDAWPQWRGPLRTGVGPSTGQGLPRSAWRTDIGRGYSSPAVSNSRVIVTGYFEGEAGTGTGEDRIACLDLESGEQLWTLRYPAKAYANEHRGGVLSTPTIARGVAYVASRAGELRALQLEDGSLLWTCDLTQRHDLQPGRYGFASSPLVLGESLYLNLGKPLALNAATGETNWIGEDLEANYCTSAPMRLGERDCLALFGGKGLAIVDREDGALVHLQEFRKGERNVEGATPIVLGTRVFISSAYDHGGMLVEFAGEAPEVLWRTRTMRTKMAGAVFYKGCFYGFDESMLRCVDLEGKDRWRVRGLGQGALIVAGGELITTTSAGELLIGPAGPEGYEPNVKLDVIEDGVFWTAPVPVGNRILMRGSFGDLVCLQRDPNVPAGVATQGLAADLPEAKTLFARHHAAMGLAPDRTLPFVRFQGQLAMNALGLVDVDGTFELLPEGQWHTAIGLPPGIGGTIHRSFDGENAWEVNPYMGDKAIDDHRLAELRSTGGMRTLLWPADRYSQVRSAAFETFAESACIRVDVMLPGDGLRHLYFDTETGLLRGRSGAEEAIVHFGDWRKVDGFLLPFQRIVFDPDTGLEERWSFEEVVLQPVPEERLQMPEKLQDPRESPEDPEDPEDNGDNGDNGDNNK